jgi:hypothetical protein
MKLKITLTEEMLGTKAANKDVFADFIASEYGKAAAKQGGVRLCDGAAGRRDARQCGVRQTLSGVRNTGPIFLR